ncbi:MAG: hypothetical protein IMZ70_00935 [Candidatus Atribacteria bacterium]|nr:hypothetical protein [Candidatus Atribacteria bacterium]MBE3087411.1 hypothetical protein [Bacteroidota bacterium]
MIYEKCEMISVSLKGEVGFDLCNVKIDEKEIRIEYANQGEHGREVHFYEAPNLGTGHFYLVKMDKYSLGKASLHFEFDSKSLVGFWYEDGMEGFWKIILKR